MQNQVLNQGQSLSIPLSANQPQPRQQLLSQNIQNNMTPAGVQGSSGLPSALPTVSGLSQTPIASVVGQNSNMQNISGVSQNGVGSSMGQGVPSNIFANSQRMQGRQQVLPQRQQQSQNPQQYLYQQQLHQQLMKQNSHPLMMQQQHQQQQNLVQPNQLQSSQQSGMQTSSVMQPSVMQSASHSSIQPNQQSSVQQSTQPMIQQHPQSVLRPQQQQQSVGVHQQQTPIPQQTMMASQQQQLMGQSNAANMQQNQLIGQQNSAGDMQQQQQQRLLSQQSNHPNMQQQQQQQQQQQLMGQQNLSSVHHQQLGPQSNVSGLQQQQQQQQLLGTQSGNSNMATNQHSVHMLQQSKLPLQQQAQQSAPNLLSNQGQQSQPQPGQQQLMSQIQSQPAQLQQQLGLQQQSNALQRDMQQRLQASSQASGPLLQPQNVVDPQKQLYQSQRALPETSSNCPTRHSVSHCRSANGCIDTRGARAAIVICHCNIADVSIASTKLVSAVVADAALSGVVYHMATIFKEIKAMKEMYYPELNEMYQKIATKLQQHDSLPQPPKSEQLEKLKIFKSMLERIITFLQVSKNNISPGFKDKIGSYQKQIVNFIATNRPRKPSMQQGQLPPPHLHPLQQPQSQISQVQSHDNQMNPQMQSMNLQGSVATMQQNNMTSLQHNVISSISGVSTAQQNMLNSLQPGSNLDSGQGNTMNSLQQVAVGSLPQNSVSASQQANINTLSSQSGVNMLQSNINPLQSNSNMLQHQHLKHQEQQMLQSQQLKQQIQQRQIQQQLMQKQQQQQLHQQQHQQLHQQAKQQLPAQLQTHQMQQLHQMNDVGDLKMRQSMGVKPGVFQQHLSSSQRPAYPHQQLKPGATFPISSPQLLQAASPQMPQHSSPQIDQQNLLSSLPKTGTPLQSANSPFVVPSPSTPLAPSPMPGDSEKPISGMSSLSNAGNIGHQQTTSAQAAAPSLAIGTPGISASPLLAEFTGPDGTHATALAAVPGKSSVTEQPLERLIKAVKSMSSNALSASVSDIGSVVSMIDRIAGSAPGNGSRAAVGEDLVAMTKCRLQARNFIIQDGMTGPRKIRRYTSAMPLNVVSSAGSMSDSSFKQLIGVETSDLESTATSSIKRPRVEVLF
ncbi:hypothetical protein JRO89_XS03G0052800 [Xanthoceras sorbifolium]|uniref:Mediator of RNA polymerase II transcription subunit 15a n=1 Tax=Xanthoceras sorbifolium TaxID=99658 RepID=A0ABQ8I8Q3_9ROSI|nr:hypothetical protein JRO89_XS03G0052800 [Xanthoceras sorbifolium]